MLPGCGLWSIIGLLPSLLNMTLDPDVLPLLDGEYPRRVSSLDISSHVKSEGIVRNRAMSFSLVPIYIRVMTANVTIF